MGRIAGILDRFGSRDFIRHGNGGTTYAAAAEAVESWLRVFPGLGVMPGDVAALTGSFSVQASLLLLALLENGNIVVPLDAESREDHALKLETARARHAFTLHDGQVRHRPVHSEGSHPLLDAQRASGEAGIIIFTSGTTGKGKAALHSFPRLIGKYERQESLRPLGTLAFLKFDHIGGLNTFFSVLLNGGRLVAAQDRSADAVCRLVERERVELLPTTPSFLNMLLLSKAHEKYDLSSLKVIAYGTEPMPESTLRALGRVFPEVKLKQTYGLTELGIFSTRSRGNDSTFMSIREDDVNIRIRDGVLHVKAENAMLGYLNAPSPFDEEGWYNTGDKVVIEDGFVKILGRDTEIINVGGEKVYPSEVESVLLEMENVRDVVVRKKENPVLGQIVMATFSLVVPEDAASLNKRIWEHCRGRLESYKVPRHIEIAEGDFMTARLKRSRTPAVDRVKGA